GAYKLSHGSSQWIDAGQAVLWTTLTMTPTYHPFTPDGHVSGAIPGADGQPLWEADNWGTTRSIWEAGATSPIETGTQRFEQLVRPEHADRADAVREVVQPKRLRRDTRRHVLGRGCLE